jgi:hypothetical protein
MVPVMSVIIAPMAVIPVPVATAIPVSIIPIMIVVTAMIPIAASPAILMFARIIAPIPAPRSLIALPRRVRPRITREAAFVAAFSLSGVAIAISIATVADHWPIAEWPPISILIRPLIPAPHGMPVRLTRRWSGGRRNGWSDGLPVRSRITRLAPLCGRLAAFRTTTDVAPIARGRTLFLSITTIAASFPVTLLVAIPRLASIASGRLRERRRPLAIRRPVRCGQSGRARHRRHQ